MPKDTTKKNSKGTKNTTTKKAVVKKVETKKTQPKKVETKVNEKKVETKIAENKVVVKNKKGNKIKELINKVIENTPFVISLCIIVILIALLILTLCMKRVPKTTEGEEILATVKGEVFTADDLYEKLKENYGTETLISLIDEYITDKEIQDFTDEDKKYVQEVVDYYKEYADYYGVDLNTFLSSYAGLSGIETEDEFYNYILKDYKKSLAIKKYIGENAKEDDIKAYYKENYSDKLTVKHILIEVDSEAKDTDAADKEAYNTAVKLIKKLDKTDSENLEKKFDELAKDYSDDTETYSNGGLIENFIKNDVDKDFWNASYELKNGKYTAEPIKTTYGYHVILKISSTPVEKYKDIKDEVKDAYSENKLNNDSTLYQTAWDELRSKYKLSFKDDVMKTAYKSMINSYKKANKDNVENTEKTEEN